jgi:hypothetical protein
MGDLAKVGPRSDKGCSHVHVRLDARRDTRMFVCRNVNGHVHITIGNEGTLILHPHAANRLAADIAAVLAGEEFSAK